MFVGNLVNRNEVKKVADSAVGVLCGGRFVVVSYGNSLVFVGKRFREQKPNSRANHR